MTDVSGGFLRPTTTPTPDELFDVWLSKLSGSELKVLLYIVRRTFGFQKEADAISLTQICEGISTRDGRTLDRGTGLTRTTAYKAVQSLEKQRLIQVTRVERDDGAPAINVYSLRFRNACDDKDEDRSGIGSNDGADADPETGQKSTWGGLITNPGVGQESTQGRLETDPGVGQKSTPQQTALQETGKQQTVGQETAGQQAAPPPDQGVPKAVAPARETSSPTGGAGEADSAAVLKQSPAQLTLIHPPPAMHASQVPVTEERGRAVDALVAFGVWRAKAEQLVDRLGLGMDVVERACAVLDEERKRGTALANPAAVLSARLESGWQPPPEPPPNPYTRWAVDMDDDDGMAAIGPPVDPRPPLPPVVTAHGTERNAYQWFADLKSELQLQLVRETYDTWLRPAELVDHVPAESDTPMTLTIRLHNLYAKAWIEHRLHKVIQRQAVRMLGKAVRLVYVGPEEAEQQADDPPWWAVTKPSTANVETERSAR